MGYRKRIFLLLFIDALLVNLAAFGSFYLRFEGNIPGSFLLTYYHVAVVSTLIFLIVFNLFGLYNRLWQYASTGELLSIVYAVTVGTGGTVTFVYFIAPSRIPHSVTILIWLLTILLIGGSRFIRRIIRENVFANHIPGSQKQVLIVGAGDAGAMVARELKNRDYRDGRPIGFIDDAKTKQRLHLMGLPVLGTRKDIQSIVKGHNIDEVVIALPSASGDAFREIVQICEQTGVEIKILPGVYDLLSGKVNANPIRQVQVEDLLGREPVNIMIDEVSGYVAGETIMVTGGGGSIGSEICRQVANFNPQCMVIVGHGENSIFDIEQEMRVEHPTLDVATEILDIKDKEKVQLVFDKYRPAVVFHTAAHKHVPLMERNPEEALKNNVLGTYNLAEAADAVGVRTFVLISTDKAVNPTSFMGATKRIAEMIIQSLDLRSRTKFVAVRFGNVLGSRGSIIPTFKKQIARGGPVTVTHPDMVRYFMTIPEAAQLVIQAGAIAQGGEVFTLDMGKPVKIVDLARDLIRLSGFEPDVDILIKFTGIRPGEKLSEELLTAVEGTTATKHSRIFISKPTPIESQLLEELTHQIRQRGSFLTREEVIALLQTVIPTFRKANEKGNLNPSHADVNYRAY